MGGGREEGDSRYSPVARQPYPILASPPGWPRGGSALPAGRRQVLGPAACAGVRWSPACSQPAAATAPGSGARPKQLEQLSLPKGVAASDGPDHSPAAAGGARCARRRARRELRGPRPPEGTKGQGRPRPLHAGTRKSQPLFPRVCGKQGQAFPAPLAP